MTLTPEAWTSEFHKSEDASNNHSDHNPILLRCGVLSPAARERPFRFEAAWITHEDSIMRGNCNVLKGLEVVRDDSIMFNRNTFGNIFRRKRRLEQLFMDLGINNFLMLSTEGRAALINVAIKKEVHEAFMIMDSFKSPGVDERRLLSIILRIQKLLDGQGRQPPPSQPPAATNRPATSRSRQPPAATAASRLHT
ncbi:hypothetical protein NC652_022575 [Populus alba x Populus x berolinensis]|nr:hypothetical protein NC652_022575 [Populus alba x Populus x berolinensis]